ncbi:MAG: DUF1624 domain-containing protein [Rubrivivax sp.]
MVERHARLDALRGLAMVWMAAFHFGFDLNHYGWLLPRQDFYGDPFWTTQRTVIVSLFLFVAGFSQAVAAEKGPDEARFWRRWAQVAGCALLVSLGSMLMFPKSWISFGVLHGVAVMLLLLRLAAPLRTGLSLLGAVALVLPLLVQHPFFDSRWTNGLGLVTRKPVTEDWVPVLPWLAAMAWGYAAGRLVLARARKLLTGALPRALRPLAALGRWPLTFYMLHQPVLIGLVGAATLLAR